MCVILKHTRGLKSKLSLAQSRVPPESTELPLEPWGAGFREGVSNVELHLSWDKVLVSQELQLPHPTSLHQLEGDMLRVRAEPAILYSHNVQFLGKKDTFMKLQVYVTSFGK